MDHDELDDIHEAVSRITDEEIEMRLELLLFLRSLEPGCFRRSERFYSYGAAVRFRKKNRPMERLPL